MNFACEIIPRGAVLGFARPPTVRLLTMPDPSKKGRALVFACTDNGPYLGVAFGVDTAETGVPCGYVSKSMSTFHGLHLLSSRNKALVHIPIMVEGGQIIQITKVRSSTTKKQHGLQCTICHMQIVVFKRARAIHRI
jgi:hypothetical protein